MAHKALSLLDILCEKSDCAYMSDLTLSPQRRSVALVAKELSFNDFPEEEWIKAAEYISAETMSFQNGTAARNYIIHLK